METLSERGSALCLILAIAWCGLAPAPVAAQPTPRSVIRVAVASPPLGAWYDSAMDKTWNWIRTSLGTRTGAIQFGLIGMLIALWIIWWRK